MNFIDATGVLADSAQLLINDKMAHDAREIVQGIVAAYDALAPDWTQAPDWAQWCAINANGLRYWFDVEPLAMHGATGWVNRGNDKQSFDKEVRLPLGIAWTICIWQRPEAQP